MSVTLDWLAESAEETLAEHLRAGKLQKAMRWLTDAQTVVQIALDESANCDQALRRATQFVEEHRPAPPAVADANGEGDAVAIDAAAAPPPITWRTTPATLAGRILAARADILGRNEDSIPYGAINDAVEEWETDTYRATSATLKAANDAAEEEQRARDAAAAAAGAQAAAAAAEAAADATAVPAGDDTPTKAADESANAKAGKDKAAPKPRAKASKVDAAIKSTPGLANFFSIQKREHAAPVRSDLLFQLDFVPGDRVVPNALRAWEHPTGLPPPAATTDDGDDVAEASPITYGAASSISRVLRRNELSRAISAAPETFDAEVCCVQWASETHDRVEFRPAFLGSWQGVPGVDVHSLARPRASAHTAHIERCRAEPIPASPATVAPHEAAWFKLPRVATLHYDSDSGDDWDSDGENLDDMEPGSSSAALSELDSEDQAFINDDLESNGDDDDDDAMIADDAFKGLARRRNLQNKKLEPLHTGVHLEVPLSRHVHRNDDTLQLRTLALQDTLMRRGTEYERLARAIYMSAGVPIPAQYLTADEATAQDKQQQQQEEPDAAAKVALALKAQQRAKKAPRDPNRPKRVRAAAAAKQPSTAALSSSDDVPILAALAKSMQKRLGAAAGLPTGTTPATEPRPMSDEDGKAPLEQVPYPTDGDGDVPVPPPVLGDKRPREAAAAPAADAPADELQREPAPQPVPASA